MWVMIILKVTNKQSFILLWKISFWKNPTGTVGGGGGMGWEGEGGQIDAPAFLRLNEIKRSD